MLHKITTEHLAHCTVIFETKLFPTVMVQKRQHLDVLQCHMSFSGLIFDKCATFKCLHPVLLWVHRTHLHPCGCRPVLHHTLL